MGIINWMVQRNMESNASELAKWAATTYYQIVASKSCASEREIFRKMLEKRGVNFDAGSDIREKFLDRYGDSVHGFCYFLGLNSPLMKGMMVSRCVQYIQCMDKYLDKFGVNSPPNEVRSGYLKTLGIPDDMK